MTNLNSHEWAEIEFFAGYEQMSFDFMEHTQWRWYDVAPALIRGVGEAHSSDFFLGTNDNFGLCIYCY